MTHIQAACIPLFLDYKDVAAEAVRLARARPAAPITLTYPVVYSDPFVGYWIWEDAGVCSAHHGDAVAESVSH